MKIKPKTLFLPILNRRFSNELICIFLFSAPALLAQQTIIRVTGSWTLSIPSTIVTEAGADMQNTFTSNPDQFEIDIKAKDWWQVEIRLDDNNLPQPIELWVRRTGNGQGGGTINGGTEFQQLSQTYQLFFTGSKNRRNIPIQFEFRNVSVTVNSGTYTTTIVYTLTD